MAREDTSHKRSALTEQKGIDQPPSVHPDSVKRFMGKQPPKKTAGEFADGIRAGDRILLSRAITLIESQKQSDTELAQDIINRCIPYTGQARRIGITGVPGVGKSCLIEALGKHLTQNGHKIAVLAIDPSSNRSKGSILGDKTRMETLANDPNAFIRPSPSGGTLGGVARKTQESMILCEAAGFDTLFIETVGVGQSETAVHGMVDFFLLLMLAGAGDELQGIKRGIMEMADLIAITKSDGQNKLPSEKARQSYENALHLFPPAPSGWAPRAMTVSAQTGDGIPELWLKTESYFEHVQQNGYLNSRRNEQSLLKLHQTIREHLEDQFYQSQDISVMLKEIENRILQGQISPYTGAWQILKTYREKLNKS